jgi:hypothetical protein
VTPRSSDILTNDIGNFIGKDVDDHTKMSLLEHPWIPPQNYCFPYSTRTVSGKVVKNYVKMSHLEAHKEWLVYSDVKKGLFCKFCPWFTNRNEGGFCKNVALKALVTEPLTNFKKLTGVTGDLLTHCNTQYHKDAVTAGKNFLSTYHCPKKDVCNLINEERYVQAQQNREKLIPIVKTVLFLGRQNIPLRGHRDDGPVSLESESTVFSNEGNFKALLRFRVDAGDKVLEKHLNTASSRSTYVSKTIQNEIIDCCKDEITEAILSRVTQAGLYSIIFDETTDSSNKAQVSLVLRYVHFGKEIQIREDFITFIDAFADMMTAEDIDVDDENLDCDQDNSRIEDELADNELSMSGENLGQIILRKITELNLPLTQCVGIGTDGCSVMLSDRGAVKEIQKNATNAIMTPCHSHKLNNSISKSSNVKVIENSVSVMKEVVSFISYPKRNTALKKFLGSKLTHLCETRWVERHDGVMQFTTSLPDILRCLEKISEWKDKKTAVKASLLMKAVTESQFIVGLFCLCEILSLTLPLSKILQKETLDLARSSELIRNLLAVMEQKRKENKENFRDIYIQARAMAEKLDVEIQAPRRCNRQTKRDNHPVTETEEYFRVSVYIPMLDNIYQDLKSRFTSDVLDVLKLPILLPEAIVNASAQDLREAQLHLVDRFKLIIGENLNQDLILMKFKAETVHWQSKWRDVEKNTQTVPTKALHVLQACDRDVYPTIHVLLQILCTLPVSNASSERSFSTLRLIKTWLRTTMSENRLVGLALLYVHPDIEVQPEKIVERFAKRGKHRMVL